MFTKEQRNAVICAICCSVDKEESTLSWILQCGDEGTKVEYKMRNHIRDLKSALDVVIASNVINDIDDQDNR